MRFSVRAPWDHHVSGDWIEYWETAVASDRCYASADGPWEVIHELVDDRLDDIDAWVEIPFVDALPCERGEIEMNAVRPSAVIQRQKNREWPGRRIMASTQQAPADLSMLRIA